MGEKMNLDKMILVPSKTRYELEIKNYDSKDIARKAFGSEEVWKNIVEGHRKQKKNLEKVIKVFGTDRMIDRSLLSRDIIRSNDLFVFLGGDNHFTYCAQDILWYLQDHPEEKKYIAGVVLDPKKSLGALLYYDVDSFLKALPRVEKDDFKVENWTTLEAKVEPWRAYTYPAVGDYFIGESNRLLMSRNRVSIDGKEIPCEKSSGILIASGQGSGKGSWYNNIHNVMFNSSDHFAKDADFARIILTEHCSRSKMTLYKGQTLVIDSYNDDKGIIAPDSHEDHAADFMIGSRAEIKVSDLKLNVIK
jgi:NAD kinase